MIEQGIYIVDCDDGNRVSIVTRFVIIAQSAQHAAEVAAAEIWPLASAVMANDEDRVHVGRIGDYSPGIGGARMQRGAIVARMALA